MDTLDQEWDNAPTPNETQISMWAHLIGIISCMSSLLGIIGTFIFYMINKDKNPFLYSKRVKIREKMLAKKSETQDLVKF